MELPASDRGGRRRPWAWWLIPAALTLAALLWGLANATQVGTFFLDGWRDHRATLLGWVRDYPVAAVLAVFALHTLLAMLALPGASLLMLVAGAGFGALSGTLLCLTACTVGASLSMLAARHFLQALVRRRLGERLAKLDRRIAADGAAYLFSLRLLPIVPFAVVNVAAGLSTMKAWTFMWVSFVGMLAGTFVYVNAGTQLARVEAAGDIYTPRVLLSLAALAVVPWLAKFILNAWQRRAGARA
jgi:uncharacterized membrane protein YdjX (TVP38/TMEM64 family)